MNFESLVEQIKHTEEYFKVYVVKSIDRHLTLRNWLLGYYIFEFEQNGEDKAHYGSFIEKELAEKLNRKGLSERNLKLFKQFYNAYPPIAQTLSALIETSDFKIVQTASASLHTLASIKSDSLDAELLINNLSFSHFVELLKVKDHTKRAYYEIECIKGTWSVRELKRQINSLSFERSASSTSPQRVAASLSNLHNKTLPDEMLKTPYVFDFLGLKDEILASESDLELALISHLKDFMLELGYGFCFETQQKRIVIGGEYFFVDLVFYHRILKCHILIELKIDAFNHHNVGQLNTYLQYYKSNVQTETDSEPIGILLCTNQNEELVEYALGGMDNNLFVREYLVNLPNKEQLVEFLKKEKEKLQ